MELRYLRAFGVLAEELNFTRAAARLHVTQQTLSDQIRRLEKDVAAPLFDRTTRSVALTAAGRTLLSHVTGVLAAVELAVAETREVDSGQRGRLIVGLGGSAGLDVTSRILRAFAAVRPNVELTVRGNMGVADTSGGLASRAVDVTIFWLPATAGVEVVPLFEDERVAVLAADHPLAALDVIPAAVLAEEPFVWADGLDQRTSDYWTLAAERGGRPPRIGARISGHEDLFTAVQLGRAVSCSPISVVRSQPYPGIVTRPVTGVAPAVLAVCYRAGELTPLVDVFVRTALEACGRDAPPT